MQFKKEILTDKNIVVHCPEKWQAIELLRWADANGKTWITGGSYIGDYAWRDTQEESCYNIAVGMSCDRTWYEDHNYKVLSYEEALAKSDTSILSEDNVYESMLVNLRNYLQSQNPEREECINAFQMSEVLGIALNKSKEEVIMDIVGVKKK